MEFPDSSVSNGRQMSTSTTWSRCSEMTGHCGSILETANRWQRQGIVPRWGCAADRKVDHAAFACGYSSRQIQKKLNGRVKAEGSHRHSMACRVRLASRWMVSTPGHHLA